METLKKLRKKSHKAEKTCTKKFWSWAGLEPVLLLARPQTILQKIRSRSYISVADSGSQLAVKICHFVGLKKRKVTTIVCVFLRKASTKNGLTSRNIQTYHLFFASAIVYVIKTIVKTRFYPPNFIDRCRCNESNKTKNDPTIRNFPFLAGHLLILFSYWQSQTEVTKAVNTLWHVEVRRLSELAWITLVHRHQIVDY